MNIGLNDYWIFKIDSGGTHNILWNKALGGTLNDFALDAARARDGGYLICGRSFSNDGDVTWNWGGTLPGDCWMAKLNAGNPAGALDWEKTIGGTGYDGANWILQARDGGIVVGAEGFSGDGDIAGHNFHPPSGTGEEAYTFKLKDATTAISIHGFSNQIRLKMDYGKTEIFNVLGRKTSGKNKHRSHEKSSIKTTTSAAE